ncbi:MAG: type VI secretion system-associated protein TagF [Rhodobacteraceae bacterium]|nr:type VI secretion system-associated protein TagF [Paracoccaceae bacterium]
MTGGFGAFGKMPSVGDFFRLNPPPGFVSPWDGWLQRAILAAQQALGQDWDAHYMSAPIWRFALSPGQAGPRKALGVLMPSVDRVGRRFPLTLMAALPTPGPAPLDHFCETALFERLEEIALAALEDTMTQEGLGRELAALRVPEFRGSPPLRQAGASLILTQAGADGILPDLAAGLLANRMASPSVWSAVVGDVPRLMICDGLPEGGDRLGLFHLGAPVWAGARPL